VDSVGFSDLTLTAAPNSVEENMETNISLSIFPNPTSENIHVSFNLSQSADVIIGMYNLTGEVVASLLNETQSRGGHSIETRLPSGIAKGPYLIKVSINGKETAQKLILY